MFHRCGCSAFITYLAYLIIDPNNARIRVAWLLFLFSAGKFQVGRWEANAFGQGLCFCSGSTLLAILIVRTNITFSIFDAFQLVFVNYSADCNLPLDCRGSGRRCLVSSDTN